MLSRLLITVLFLNQSFIYNTESTAQFGSQELTLIVYVQTQKEYQLDLLKTEVDNIMTLDKLRLIIETKMQQYPVNMAMPSTTRFVDTIVEDMLQEENKKTVILHKNIVNSLKDFWIIAAVNKRIFNALHESLNQSLVIKRSIIDSLFIKWSPIARAYCDILGCDSVMDYFGLKLTGYYGLFAKILREENELVKSFIRAMFVQQAFLLSKQLMVEKYKEKVVQNVELFLKQEVKTAQVYELYSLIPLDICPQESLLKFLCEKNNVVMENKNHDGRIQVIYLTPVENRKRIIF